jgi:hypothetical protein
VHGGAGGGRSSRIQDVEMETGWGGRRDEGEWIRWVGKNRKEKEGEKIGKKKKIEKGKGNRKRREGHYGHFTFLSMLHSCEELFCQTFSQNSFIFNKESASPA